MAQVWLIQGTDTYEYSDIVLVYICVLDHSSYFDLPINSGFNWLDLEVKGQGFRFLASHTSQV